MCGLTGQLGLPAPPQRLREIVTRMSEAIAHRGPDDSGDWVDDREGFAVAFRRLAIIDISPAGHQPMESAGGRYVLAFNGEVYNYEAIRRELRNSGYGRTFRGHSDTEVILAAFETWGIQGAVSRFIGMFAMALWDRHERRLHLIRDRLGVKPMYYGFAGKTFVFGSELKALARHPDFERTIDRDALALYMKFLYVPTPYTIYRGMRKQFPGTIVSVGAAGDVRTTEYWSVRQVAEAGSKNLFRGTREEAADALEELLRDSVRLRMISDVPLGVFLSGGVDSSVVAALMQAQSRRPVKTFSIGFAESSYDEAHHAAAVARHLGTDHMQMYVSARDAQAVIPKLPSMFDEPFADSSQIPTHLVSALARRHVTVSLSGDGGDELFGGYARYFLGQRLLDKSRWIPPPLRAPVARTVLSVPAERWDSIFRAGAAILRRREAGLRAGQRIHKVARAMLDPNQDQMYFELVCHWKGIVPDAAEDGAPVLDEKGWAALDDPIDRMMFFDQISYLPDDILTKVDRASMSVSLEAREPLLDHRLVEFAWRLPLSMKVGGGRGKLVLRDVLDRYVPQQLIDRPKMGFGIPLEEWLRKPLRDWAESLLSTQALEAHGLIDPKPVRRIWKEHLAGTGQWQMYIWAVLMFQAWYAEANATVAAPEDVGASM